VSVSFNPALRFGRSARCFNNFLIVQMCSKLNIPSTSFRFTVVIYNPASCSEHLVLTIRGENINDRLNVTWTFQLNWNLTFGLLTRWSAGRLH